MLENPVVLTVLDFIHQMATIAWIGGMVFNLLAVMPTVSKVLEPALAGKFMGSLMKRVRVIVYVSLLVLFVTGIPMKIASEYYVAIINFDTAWETASFVKHVLVAILALVALYSFELLSPKVGRLAAKGPSAELVSLRKRQQKLAAVSFLLGIAIVFISVMMKYL
ncbi:MAG: DUF4149 domain-containing protein [Bacteroidales bacterium]